MGIILDKNAYDHFFIHFWFASSWQPVHLSLCPPGGGEQQVQRHSQQASGHWTQRQPSFHSRCSTIMEQNHSTLARSLFQALDTTAPQGTNCEEQKKDISLYCMNFYHSFAFKLNYQPIFFPPHYKKESFCWWTDGLRIVVVLCCIGCKALWSKFVIWGYIN